eukprot:5824715-Prymnesium_polylepis.1
MEYSSQPPPLHRELGREGRRDDGTTWLCCRFPVVLWTEEDVAIIPPDTAREAGPNPFYLDPVDQPGAFRDIFK